jgi:hypothetical protein
MRRLLIAVTFCAVASAARADQKNVQVLTGLSDLELQRGMNMIRASLGVNCDYCHVNDDKKGWDFGSDAKKEKETARDMIQMTEKLNREQFGGRSIISCNTCHRGSTHPVALVGLPQTAPPFATPKPVRAALPALEEIVKHYTAAIGDVTKWDGARILRGTRESSDGKSLPIEIHEAAGRIHVAVTTPNGKVEQWYEGTSGVSRDATGVHKFDDSQLENVRQLAMAYAPMRPAAIPKDARVAGRETIGDHETIYVTARLDDKTRERLYFDATTGLLLRRVIIRETTIGPIPQQSDFDDYREIDGVKFPFMVRVSLVDPWSSATRRYTAVQLGAKVDDAVFTPPSE